MFGFLIGEALRDLRRAGRLAVSAVVLITLSVVAARCLLDPVHEPWRRDRSVAGAGTRDRLSQGRGHRRRRRLSSGSSEIPGVMAARYVSKAEALETLRVALGKDAAVVDRLSTNPASRFARDHAGRRCLDAGAPRELCCWPWRLCPRRRRWRAGRTGSSDWSAGSASCRPSAWASAAFWRWPLSSRSPRPPRSCYTRGGTRPRSCASLVRLNSPSACP